VVDAGEGGDLLMEGMSVRAVERLTGVCRQTICDLILVVGGNGCRNWATE
jgi:hypothetical protein